LPLVLGIPAGTVTAFPNLADGNPACRLVAYVPIDIGEDEVEGGNVPGLERGAERGGREGAIHVQKSRQPAALVGTEPFQRDGSGLPRRRRQNFINDRTVPGVADRFPHRFAAPDGNDLLPRARRLPAAVEEEAVRLRRVGLLLVKVALRTDVIGAAPGDALIAAKEDARHARIGR